MENITSATQSKSATFVLLEVQAVYFTFLGAFSSLTRECGAADMKCKSTNTGCKKTGAKNVMTFLYKNCFWVESKSGYEKKKRVSP